MRLNHVGLSITLRTDGARSIGTGYPAGNPNTQLSTLNQRLLMWDKLWDTHNSPIFI